MSAEETPRPEEQPPLRSSAPLGGGGKRSPFAPRRSLAFLFGAFVLFTMQTLSRPDLGSWAAAQRPAELVVRLVEAPLEWLEADAKVPLPLGRPDKAFENAADGLRGASRELFGAASRAEGERADLLERDGRELALRSLILRAEVARGTDPLLSDELERYGRERRGDPALDAVLRVYGRAGTRGAPEGPVSEAELSAARELAGSPSGDRLLAGLLRADGDDDAATALEETIAARANRRIAHVGRVMTALFAVGGAGLLCLVWLIVARSRDLRFARAELPPGDSAPLGFDLFARGLFGAQVVLVGLGLLAGATGVSVPLGIAGLCAWSPLVILAARHVGPGIARTAAAFGLLPGLPALRRLVPIVLATFIVQTVGFAALAAFAAQLLGPDATNAALEVWVLGDGAARAGLLTEAVVWAPLFEELAFRALLFGALRARMGFGGAAFASSILFAAVHPYGVAALFPMTWLGIVFCWAYERTRSLWTSILLHALHNGSALLFATIFWE